MSIHCSALSGRLRSAEPIESDTKYRLRPAIRYQLAPEDLSLEAFNDILDYIVLLLNQYASNNQCASPFLFIMRNDVLHEVKVLKKDQFAKIFDELIIQLHTHHKVVPINIASPSLLSIYNNLLNEVSASKIAEDIMLDHGGFMFPMFPPCVGYCLCRQHESLICVQPSDMYVIDDEIFSAYISNSLRKRFE